MSVSIAAADLALTWNTARICQPFRRCCARRNPDMSAMPTFAAPSFAWGDEIYERCAVRRRHVHRVTVAPAPDIPAGPPVPQWPIDHSLIRSFIRIDE